jgi:CRISPR-associated protein Cas5t
MTLWLHLQAPFAAFRWMQAGVYRATSPVIPPSAAWGLVLNLAGVETRGADDGTTTQVRGEAPPLCLAIGAVREAEVGSLYQQLHGYPVGSSFPELKTRARGAKYGILPVRREVLVGFDCVLGVRAAEDGLLDRVVRGLRGELGEPRYGLPFAGDNNLLFDRIDVVGAPPPAQWYSPLSEDEEERRAGSCRLTVAIDRRDASRTATRLFAPGGGVESGPPESAWVWVPRAPISA